MSDEQTYYRKRLQECVNRIPASINTASVQKARAFKGWAVRAQKLLANNKAKLDQLRSACSEYNNF